MPVRCGYLPVNSDAREGEQTGQFEYQLVNRTPSAASLSKFGVRASFAP